MNCPKCNTKMKKNGKNRSGNQQYYCSSCHETRTKRLRKEGQLLGAPKKHIIRSQAELHYDSQHSSVSESAKTRIKKVISTSPGFDALDKAALADKIAHDYNMPIGQVNHMIERIKRANGV